jgi:ABC-type transporter Mla subunit MlaD
MPALLIAAIMIAIPVFVTYYAFHKALPFTSQYTDYVVVPNSVNVRGGDPVRVAGIDVGSVEGTTPDGRATKIAFSVSSQALPLHSDAWVAVRDRLFLEGSYYLDLHPGSPSAPVVKEGFTIPEQNTQTPVQFFQVLSTFDVAARANLRTLLNTANEAFSPSPGHPLSDSGAGGFKRAIPQLTPLLKDIAIDAPALRGTQPGDLQRLLAGSAGVFTALAQDRGGRLADLVTGLDRVSSALASSDGALAASMAGLDQTLRAAPPALTAIDRALPPLSKLAVALTPTLRAAPPIVSGINSTLSRVLTVVNPSVRGRLLSSLHTTLATFPSVLTKIGELFSTTGAVTDCLRTHLVPILKEEVPDGKLSTHEPVWKDFVHFLPNLSAASGQFDGNGPYIRNLVGAGDNSLQLGNLGSLPGVGKLIGLAPGGNQIEGSTPKWVGTLTSSAFHPEVPCSRDPVPSLASPASAAADQRSRP